MDGRYVRYGRIGGFKEWVDGWMGGQREKVRGVYGFSSLMKQKIKAKNYAVFYFAGKRFFFYFYDVITSRGKEKSFSLYYSR